MGGVTLLGHGRLGSAIAEGWKLTGAVPDPAILTRAVPPVCPPGTRVLVVAVKPSAWREAVAPLLESLPSNAVVVSVMAGVRAVELTAALTGRAIVRVMPTTAVAQAKGVAAIWSDVGPARALAHALFDPIADTVDLPAEALIDVATAVAGSGPAYVHAFTRALAEAGVAKGLDEASALRLARGAIRSAASADPSASLADLIARVASPGGTTEAGLKALAENRALDAAVEAAVDAALHRARQLGGS